MTTDLKEAGRESAGMRLDKLLSLAAGILILAVLITAARTPLASGYEISIYEAFPLYFWLLFVGAIACGVGILLHHAFGKAQSRWWVSGLLIIVATNSIILLLPVFRGYAVYGRYDTLTHLGLIRDIAATGHIGDNWYPIEHLLGGSIAQIGGVSIESTLYVLFVLISGVYILNLYLLGHAITRDRRNTLVILAFAAPLIYALFHVNIHPMLLSLFMVILVLYCYHRRSEIPRGNALQYAIIMIVATFAVVYAHPATCLFAIVGLLGLGLSEYIFSKRVSPGEPLRADITGSVSVALRASLILLAAFFVWYFNFPEMEARLESAYGWLTGGGGTPLAQEQVAAAEQVQLAFKDAVRIVFNSWGAMLLLLSISAAVAAVVLVRHMRRRGGGPERVMFVYAALFVIGGVVSLAEFFGVGGESDHPERIGRFAILMGTVLVGLAAYRIVHLFAGQRWFKAATMTAVFLLVIAMTGLSLGAVYTSPRVSKLSAQLTHLDRTGFEWFEEHKDSRIAIIARSYQSVSRLQDYLFGVHTAPETIAKWLKHEKVPSHLGYDSHDHFSEHVDFHRMRLRITGGDIDHRYVLLTRTDELYPLAKPENVRTRLVAYTEPDFAALGRDPSIARLYYNGEFEIWLATRDEGGA